MAGIETAVEAACRYIIKRPRLTRLLDRADARVLMLIAPAGFGKTTLAREWAGERRHVWYRGTTATADVAALIAGFATTISEILPEAGTRTVARMRATGTPEHDVDILADLFAEDLADWPADTWLVFDDYQFAMEARAPERFVDLLLRKTPLRLLLTSRKRPTWASARRLLYGEVYELGRSDMAMNHDEAAEVLAHRKGTPAAGLVTLAEGWPAVIGLAALAEESELPEGSLPDALYEYFAEELFQATTPEIQRDLCRLALAPSLGPSVSEFLLGARAGEVITEGVRLGFLSARSGSLELHPLLRTFLDAKTPGEAEETRVDAQDLARHLATQGVWDDVLVLVDRFFSEDLFVSLLESGLRTMLAEARLATLARWISLGDSRRVDAAIIDLAQGEMAFYRGERRKSETLALRASRRLNDTHPLQSRSHYLAAMSAHLDYHNERAREHCNRALSNALTPGDKREAVWGQFIVSLDLDLPGTRGYLGDLERLDDGSVNSELRLAIARFLLAVRTGSLRGLDEFFSSAELVAPRAAEPHMLSSFYSSGALLLALAGRYEEALAASVRCERYAVDVRLPFVIPHARRIRAIAELGLRHFSRSRQLLDSLERQALKGQDVFLEVEARLIRSRLLLAQGLSTQAVEVLREPPRRFPFQAEKAEFLATLGLALACDGREQEALRLSDEAQSIAQTVEVATLVPCIAAIASIGRASPAAGELASQALEATQETGGVDSFVIAYRGFPKLLQILATETEDAKSLGAIIDRARDWELVKSTNLGHLVPRRGRTPLTPREREVIGLIAQGLTNKEIAQTLFVSESTTKVHVRHILEKLGARSRTEAALRAADVLDAD